MLMRFQNRALVSTRMNQANVVAGNMGFGHHL